MAEYTKGALQEMGARVAHDFVEGGTSLNDGIRKIASSKGLSTQQVSRVCEFANHAANAAMMKKQAYVSFELANPGKVQLNKEAFYLAPEVDEASNLSKTASLDDADEALYDPLAEEFAEVSKAYGVQFNPAADTFHLLKAARAVAHEAFARFEAEKVAFDQDGEKLYKEVRQSLLSGVTVERLKSDFEKQGRAGELDSIWSRLEAERLVPTKHYEDAGPYSEERILKHASANAELDGIELELSADSDLMKVARHMSETSQNLDVHAQVGITALEVLFANGEDLEPFAKEAGAFGNYLAETGRRVYQSLSPNMRGAANVGGVIGRVGMGLGRGVVRAGSGIARGGFNAIKKVGPMGSLTAVYSASQIAGSAKEIAKRNKIRPL